MYVGVVVEYGLGEVISDGYDGLDGDDIPERDDGADVDGYLDGLVIELLNGVLDVIYRSFVLGTMDLSEGIYDENPFDGDAYDGDFGVYLSDVIALEVP